MAGKSRNRKALPPRPKTLVDNSVQTEIAFEAVSVVLEADGATTSDEPRPLEVVISIDQLTKEQLIARFRALQAFVRRMRQMLMASECLRKRDRQCLEQMSHDVKVLIIEQRQTYISLQDLLRSSSVVFANSQEELVQNVQKLMDTLEEDKRFMRNTIAQNNVVVEKARVGVVNAKAEIERVIGINEKLKQEIETAQRERAFVECQYHELRDKQNKEYLANEFLCPKCKAWKACLNELTDSIAPMKEELKNQKKDLQKSQREKQSKDKQISELKIQLKRVCNERDTYKDHNAKLMDRQKHFRKLLSEKNSPLATKPEGTPTSMDSPVVVNGNHLISSPLAAPPISQTLSPVKDVGIGSSLNSSPDVKPVQKRRNSDPEEGEVVTPEETPASPIPPAPQPTRLSKTALKKKRKAEALAANSKLGKPPMKKVYDYVYVMNDCLPPSAAPESRPIPPPQHMSPPTGSGWRGPPGTVDPYDFGSPPPPRYGPRQRPGFSSPIGHRMPAPGYLGGYQPDPHDRYGDYYRQPRYHSAAEHPGYLGGGPSELPWHAGGANRGRPPPNRHPNGEDWTAWR